MRLTTFLDSIQDISVEPDPDAVAALTEQTDKNIDFSEAGLFAVCPRIPDSIVVTGDKKSLAGLHAAAQTDSDCHRIYQALEGRVVCFEQLLSAILNQFGFDAIRDRLVTGRECDTGLALWLGSGLDANEERFREGLTSFLNEARRNSGSLLRP